MNLQLLPDPPADFARPGRFAEALPQPPSGPAVTPEIAEQISNLGDRLSGLDADYQALARAAGLESDGAITRLEIFHGYIAVFVIAFIVTLLATPLMRRLAVAHGIIDRPSEARKVHRLPIAYLGGAAVFLGLMAGILYSYVAASVPGLIAYHDAAPDHLIDGLDYPVVPLSVLAGLMLIMLVGLLDDIVGIPPHLKIGGQLLAAAALAADNVGVKVAAGVVVPLAKWLGLGTTTVDNFETLLLSIPLPIEIPGMGGAIQIDVVYWTGTAIIALFVLGACNASNLIDGLDGLLSGTTAIASAGLLVIALSMALRDDGPRDAQRLVLCLALLGACLGFLPHNFNPATIFLGDAGSLLLGFATIVVILTLGDTGQTHLVFAGLIIYAIPIIDTVLAIVRRKLAGKSISDADDQHLHHMLKRALGVKGAVLALYGIGAGFAALGVWMSLGRARVVYALALVFAAFIVVTAVKIARRKHIEEEAARSGQAPGGPADGAPAALAAPRPAEDLRRPAPLPAAVAHQPANTPKPA